MKASVGYFLFKSPALFEWFGNGRMIKDMVSQKVISRHILRSGVELSGCGVILVVV